MDDKQRNDANQYVRYSAMGFQMLAIIGVFAFVGYQLDQKEPGNYLWTALLSLLGVVLSLYQVIRGLKKNK